MDVAATLSDPLTLLREFTLAKQPVQLIGEHVVFGRVRFPRGALTAYRASGKDKPFYPIDALLFLLEKQKQTHGEYVKECAASAVMPVSLPDRRALLNYLSGVTDTSPAIDMTGAPFVQAELVPTAAEAEAAAAAAEATAAAELDEAENMYVDQEAKEEAAAAAAEAAARAEEVVREAKEAMRKLLKGPHTELPAAVESGDAEGSTSAMEVDGAAAGNNARAQAPKAKFQSGRVLSAARPFIKADREVTAGILKREKRLRSRETILLAPVAGFPVITQILEGFRKKNKALEAEAKARTAAASVPAGRSASSAHRPPSTDGDRPRAATSGDVKSASTASAKRQSSHAPSASSNGAAHSRRVAVMVVPAAITAPVNLWNVAQLLRDKQWVSPVELKQGGAPKPSIIKIEHTFEDGSTCMFDVIENPLKLKPPDWSNVACVVVQGNTWQFKGWPYKSEADLFTKVLGVHMRTSDEQPNQLVKNWNVQKYVFSKEKVRQHDVAVTVTSFWQAVHKFLLVHKPHLVSRPELD